MVSVLMKAGCDISIRDNDNETGLNLARKQSNQITEMIIMRLSEFLEYKKSQQTAVDEDDDIEDEGADEDELHQVGRDVALGEVLVLLLRFGLRLLFRLALGRDQKLCDGDGLRQPGLRLLLLRHRRAVRRGRHLGPPPLRLRSR